MPNAITCRLCEELVGLLTGLAPHLLDTHGINSPICSECGDSLALRRARHGASTMFWGCHRFPYDRTTMPFKRKDTVDDASWIAVRDFLANRPTIPTPRFSARAIAKAEAEDLTFHYWLSDLDETARLEDDDDWMDWSFSAEVLRLDSTHFQINEPVSLTFAGQFGPSLDLGVIFEAEPLDDGTYHLLRIIKRRRVWKRQFDCSYRLHDIDEVRSILSQIEDLGGKWEWTSGTLAIQGLLARGEKDVPTEINGLVAALVTAVKAKKRMAKKSNTAANMSRKPLMIPD